MFAGIDASCSRSADTKPSFCQNGPDRRENNQALRAPSLTAPEGAKRARRDPLPTLRALLRNGNTLDECVPTGFADLLTGAANNQVIGITLHPQPRRA